MLCGDPLTWDRLFKGVLADMCQPIAVSDIRDEHGRVVVSFTSTAVTILLSSLSRFAACAIPGPARRIKACALFGWFQGQPSNRLNG